MDTSCNSSGDFTAGGTCNTSNNGRKDQYLNHLNKLSHKISKPNIKKPSFNPQNQNPTQTQSSGSQNQPPPAQQQHQPPVYNISRNNFRDMVQKLTGSPAHERISTPTAINPPKPQNSRLQRIRPPPLAYVSNRPPSMLTSAIPPILNPNNSIGRFGSPLSPLPPLPTVHAAAESPVSAYMRYIRNSTPNFDSNSKQFSGFSPLISPKWNTQVTQLSQLQLPQPLPPPQIPFGCLSPRSPYPLHPSLLFSPSSGQLGFPLSPTVPEP